VEIKEQVEKLPLCLMPRRRCAAPMRNWIPAGLTPKKKTPPPGPPALMQKALTGGVAPGTALKYKQTACRGRALAQRARNSSLSEAGREQPANAHEPLRWLR